MSTTPSIKPADIATLVGYASVIPAEVDQTFVFKGILMTASTDPLIPPTILLQPIYGPADSVAKAARDTAVQVPDDVIFTQNTVLSCPYPPGYPTIVTAAVEAAAPTPAPDPAAATE